MANSDVQPSPGPWRVDGAGIKAMIRAEDATIVALRHRLPGVVNDANMKLIAAAPDMLAALQEISAMYQRTWDLVDGGLTMGPDSIPRFEDAHKAVRIAISKAISDGKDPLLDGDDFS